MANQDREVREQRAYERLGTDKPRCPCCGEADWRCLEAHHVAGRKRDEFTVPMCANCHRKLTDTQKDYPHVRSDEDRLLETVGHFLLGLADLCSLLVQKLRQFANALLERSIAPHAVEVA